MIGRQRVGSHSGLVRLLGEQLGEKSPREFESHTLRRVERSFERPRRSNLHQVSKMQSLPRVFLFDVGNVMIEADHAITYKILEDFGVHSSNAEQFYSNTEYLEFNRGNISANDFYRILIEKYLKYSLTYEQVVWAHNQHIYAVSQDVEEILQTLSRHRISFTTDTNEWQTERERELIDLRKYSDSIFRSHEIHMLKIDQGLFPYLLKKLDAKAEEILFIDDSIEKVKIAENYGLLTLLFKDAAQLSNSLKNLDIAK